MGQAQTKEQKATQRQAPPQLHHKAMGHHEIPAKPHHEAAEGLGCEHDKAASHHTQLDHGLAVHATMHWIDPKSLPETSGAVSKFLYNVHGHADGFLLDGDQQVHFAPHMSEELLKTVKVGDKVVVRGVKPRAVDLLVAASIIAPNGTEIVDHGPGAKPQKP